MSEIQYHSWCWVWLTDPLVQLRDSAGTAASNVYGNTTSFQQAQSVTASTGAKEVHLLFRLHTEQISCHCDSPVRTHRPRGGGR
jgi:hypothetical protein